MSLASRFSSAIYVLDRSIHRCKECEKLGIDNQMEEFNLQPEPQNILLRCPINHWVVRPRRMGITLPFLNILEPILIRPLLQGRLRARAKKDYKYADELRELIEEFCYDVLDFRDSSRIRYNPRRHKFWNYQFNPTKTVNTIPESFKKLKYEE